MKRAATITGIAATLVLNASALAAQPVGSLVKLKTPMLVCISEVPITRIGAAGPEAKSRAEFYIDFEDCKMAPAGTEYLVERVSDKWARIRERGSATSSYAQRDQLAANAAIRGSKPSSK